MLCRSTHHGFKGLTGLLILVGFVGAGFMELARAEGVSSSEPGVTVAPIILSGRQPSRPPGKYSAGVEELLALLNAKVDAQVILAYIQNSPIPYDPEANELIVLHEHGASADILSAILRHGDELRLQLAQSQSPINPQPGPLSYEAMPPQEIPPGYPISEEDVYPAVTYYAAGYWWPWLCPAKVHNTYRPYEYHRGCWVSPHNEPQQIHVNRQANTVESQLTHFVSAGHAESKHATPVRGSASRILHTGGGLHH